jgi:hypothetical protein
MTVDDYALDDEQDDGTEESGEPTDRRDLVRHLRKVIEDKDRKHQKEVAKAAKETEDRITREFARKAIASQVFTGLGYPAMAEVWLKTNPEGDLSADVAQTFLTGLGVPVQGGDEEGTAGVLQAPQPPPGVSPTAATVETPMGPQRTQTLAPNPAAGFHNASGGESPNSEVVSAAEWLQVYQTDSVKADQLAREGRVTFKHKGIQGGGVFGIKP